MKQEDNAGRCIRLGVGWRSADSGFLFAAHGDPEQLLRGCIRYRCLGDRDSRAVRCVPHSVQARESRNRVMSAMGGAGSGQPARYPCSGLGCSALAHP